MWCCNYSSCGGGIIKTFQSNSPSVGEIYSGKTTVSQRSENNISVQETICNIGDQNKISDLTKKINSYLKQHFPTSPGYILESVPKLNIPKQISSESRKKLQTLDAMVQERYKLIEKGKTCIKNPKPSDVKPDVISTPEIVNTDVYTTNVTIDYHTFSTNNKGYVGQTIDKNVFDDLPFGERWDTEEFHYNNEVVEFVYTNSFHETETFFNTTMDAHSTMTVLEIDNFSSPMIISETTEDQSPMVTFTEVCYAADTSDTTEIVKSLNSQIKTHINEYFPQSKEDYIFESVSHLNITQNMTNESKTNVNKLEKVVNSRYVLLNGKSPTNMCSIKKH